MSEKAFVRVCGLVAVVLTATACTSTGEEEPLDPGLAPRGTVQTTATPTRQDLSNKVSLTGKVTMNPTFGIVSPLAGEVRYWVVAEPTGTPSNPTRIASIWVDGKPTNVDVPAGSTFGGRLVDDRSTVTAGMPIASAKYAGYGIVAEIGGEQAYQISDAATGTVQAQIKNGPGPFPCTLLGTIAALPAGTVPAPVPVEPESEQGTGSSGTRKPAPPMPQPPREPRTSSEPTGLRLVCTAPADVKLINGAAATLELVTASAKNALVVPVEAVAGGQGKGKVDVVGPDGAKRTKDVELGLTDGKVVEIKTGLTGDETLAVPGPNLPPAPNGQGGPETGSK
ncbi:efflux RND transporter periplasmic adaptor subunit [Saccharothrix isguenensis]